MLINSINPAVSCHYDNVRKIHIYGNGEIFYTAERGELEESRIDGKGRITTVYDGKIRGITLATEPKRAVKLNLSRKDNFYMKYHGDYSWESGISLYIHISEISATPAGEFLAFENSGERCYKNAVRLHFNHGATVHRLNCERVADAGRDFVPPEGCKWSKNYSPNPEKPFYDVFRPIKGVDETQDPVVVKRWISKETIDEILVESSYYTRRETDPGRAYRERVADAMSKCLSSDKHISHYEVEKLLTVFNITFKEDTQNEMD